MHAEDMRENCFSAQWGSDGTKPYMRYTLAGGTQYSLHATTGTEYCPPDPDRYESKSLEEEVREVKLSDDVLLPYLKKVNLGFAYSKPNLWVVQQFEGDYIEYDDLPVIGEEGKLSFSASVKNGAIVKDDALGVQIYYDPTPRKLTRGQLARTYCYSTGKKQLASLREPLTDGRYYTEDEYTESDSICVDPYEIDPDSPPANSYEESSQLHDEAKKLSVGRTESYKVAWITADQWVTSESDFSVSADIKQLLLDNREGVYTILIWGEIDGEDIPISEYSIFVTRDQFASMSLDIISQPTNTPTAVTELPQINSPTPAPTDTPIPEPTYTPIPADTSTPTVTDTPTPAPVNTSTPTPEPSPANTPTPTPVLIRNSGLTAEELEQANSLMLDLINQARREAGLNEVVLGDNTAAQMHAEDMRKNCFFAHWGSNGTKPYMRYTLAGGTQYSRYIINGADYCPPDPDRYRYKSLEEEILEVNLSDSVLTPYLKKVNLGFAYSKPNLWVVQEYETDHLDYSELPAINEEGKLSFSASVKNGTVVKDDALGVQIYYDPTPHDLTRGQLSRTYCYSTGNKQLASLRKPLTDGYYYTTNEYTETDDICVDPYEIDPDSAPANSYEEASQLHDEAERMSSGNTAPYKVVRLTADQWSTSETEFSVSADIKQLLLNNREGVYTILIWGVIDSEDIPISRYSIFIPPDQLASMSLDAPSQPTNTPTTVPEPSQINSPTPQPSDTSIPTATYTPVPIDTPIPTPTYTPTETSTHANTPTPTPLPASPTFIKWVIADGVRPQEVQAAKDGAQAMYDLAIHLGLPQPTEEIRVYLDYDIQRLAHSYVSETSTSLTDATNTFENERVGGLASRISNSAYIKTEPPNKSISPNDLEWVTEATAHEITHVAYQRMLLGLDTNPAWFQENRADSPDWLTEGMADLYSVIATDLISQIPYYLDRSELAVSSAELGFPLTAIEDVDLEDSEDGIWICQYDCGFIAVELLASHVGLTGLSNYYTMRRPASSWQYAFQTTFGMTVDEFYTLFEEHRTNGFPALDLDETPGLKKDRPTSNTKLPWATNASIPHDVRIQVIDSSWMLHDYAVSLGMSDMRNKLNLYLYSTEDELARAIANEEGTSQQNAREYLNDDYPVTSGQRWMTINASDEWFSETSIEYRMIFVGQELTLRYQAVMAPYNYHKSPYWLDFGVAEFLALQSLSEYGVLNYDSRRWEIVDGALGVEKTLSGMVTWEGYSGVNNGDRDDYSILAVELLTSRAGQSALIEYYKLLKLNSTWLEAFYKAFGMTVEEFYDLFSRHRADGFPKVDIPKFVTR